MTVQMPDIIHMPDGRDWKIPFFGYGDDAFPGLHTIGLSFNRSIYHTGCYRGYTARYEVVGNRIHLVRVTVFADPDTDVAPDLNYKSVTVEPNINEQNHFIYNTSIPLDYTGSMMLIPFSKSHRDDRGEVHSLWLEGNLVGYEEEFEYYFRLDCDVAIAHRWCDHTLKSGRWVIVNNMLYVVDPKDAVVARMRFGDMWRKESASELAEVV